MRRFLFTLALLCLAVPAWAQDAGYESITVAGSSIGLTASTYAPSGLAMATCTARVETGEIRYRVDGVAPTATEGMVLEPGDVLMLNTSGEMAAARFIRTNATSGTLKVTCLRNPGEFMITPGPYGVEWNRVFCVVTVATATTVQAVGGSCAAPGAGLSLYVTDIEFGTSAAAGTAADSFPTLKYGTGGTCGTGTTVFWQALVAANTTQVANYTTARKIPANNELCWIMTTAGSKTLQINGYIAP